MKPNQPIPILVAEDNSADVVLVRMALDARGLSYELHQVVDGEQAIEFIRRADRDYSAPRPGVVLLDMNLPKKEGAEVLSEIRASRNCGQVPVIVITSSDWPKDVERANSLGATRYFKKPSELDEFMSLGVVVEEVLGLGDDCASA